MNKKFNKNVNKQNFISFIVIIDLLDYDIQNIFIFEIYKTIIFYLIFCANLMKIKHLLYIIIVTIRSLLLIKKNNFSKMLF